MTHREVKIGGTVRVVDVLHLTQSVRTPWGVLTAKPGDVLLPWGDTVVPMPGALLDALTESETKPLGGRDWSKEWSGRPHDEPAEEHAEATAEHVQETEARLDLDTMKRPALVKLAAQRFPKEQPWFKMSRNDVLAALRERGF